MKPKPHKPAAKTTPEKPFLVDSVDGRTKDMPSITKLLDRKKLMVPGISDTNSQITSPDSPFQLSSNPVSGLGGVKPKPQPEAKAQAPKKFAQLGGQTSIAIPDSLAATALELTSPDSRRPEPMQGTLAGATQMVGVQVIPSARSTRASNVPSIAAWSKSATQPNSDPLQDVLHKLLEKGAQSALFLSIQETRTAPRLIATAGIGSHLEQARWKGLHWDTSSTGQVWPTVSRMGILEIRPDEQQGVPSALRVAIGVEPGQWLSLLRVGNSAQCAGVLAIISNTSLQAHLPEARAQLMTAGSASSVTALAA